MIHYARRVQQSFHFRYCWRCMFCSQMSQNQNHCCSLLNSNEFLIISQLMHDFSSLFCPSTSAPTGSDFAVCLATMPEKKCSSDNGRKANIQMFEELPKFVLRHNDQWVTASCLRPKLQLWWLRTNCTHWNQAVQMPHHFGQKCPRKSNKNSSSFPSYTL